MSQKLNPFLTTTILFLGLTLATYGQTKQTTLGGVYTAGQADKGGQDFANYCARCHEGADPEGPILFGRTFVDRWREENLDVLFTYVKTRMPRDREEPLSDRTYLQILAFMLHENDYRAGSQELTTSSLGHIRFVGKDGPKPLPPNTLVKVVGCLTQDNGVDWQLTRSTEPVRSREGRESTEEELKRSVTQPLGSLTFRLQNFANIRLDFKPDPFKGHKVQVKGVLIRQSNSERITPTLLESLGAECGRS